MQAKQIILKEDCNYSNKCINEDRKKYGLNAFETTILAEVETRKKAWELEQKYIIEYNSIYPSGYNMSYGGAGPKGTKHSAQSRKKMSETHKGLTTWMKGKHHTEISKQKISEKNKGKISFSKSVVQYDKDWNEIKRWASAKEAALSLGIGHSHICRCCKGVEGFYSAGGFKWKYA